MVYSSQLLHSPSFYISGHLDSLILDVRLESSQQAVDMLEALNHSQSERE
jgi:hypothetical protein